MRGLAAIAVLLGHYFRAYGWPPGIPSLVWNTPAGSVADGYAAVSLFFVLSGFVLTRGYARSANKLSSVAIGGFAVKRAARILLPFLAVLWITAGVERFTHSRSTTVPVPTEWVSSFVGIHSARSVVRQSFLFLGLDPGARILPQDWSLTAELNISILTPLLAFVAFRSTPVIAAVSIVAVGWLNVHSLLLAFSAGILIGKYWAVRQMNARPSRVSGWFWAIPGLALSSAREWMPHVWQAIPRREAVFWLCSDLGAAILVWALINNRRAQQCLESRALVRAGEILYSVYLWHFPILLYGVPPFLSRINELGIRGVGPAWTLGLLFLIVTTLSVSRLCYNFVERPSVAIGKRMARLGKRPPALGTAKRVAGAAVLTNQQRF